MCRTVSLASHFRSWMRMYKGSCLKAWWLRPWCHPFYVVICPHGFFKHSLVWWGPGGAIDPVAGHVLSEELQCDRSLTLEAVKHWPDFILWQEGQRRHLSYEVDTSIYPIFVPLQKQNGLQFSYTIYIFNIQSSAYVISIKISSFFKQPKFWILSVVVISINIGSFCFFKNLLPCKSGQIKMIGCYCQF